MTTLAEEILKVNALKKYFRTSRGTVRAVDGVSFTIEEGETLGLVGESGSGKSTVAYVIMGIYPPTAGQILFRDRDIGKEARKRPKALKKEIQIVFQDPGSSLNPRRTIKQIIELPLKVHGLSRNMDRTEQVIRLLEMVELPIDYLYKYPQAIGGGEKQMVAIARAL
ncbi:MAG: ATP-binding cassette domain-containing protein, partial [Candidatus Bipolaricaulia bacterium]